ncbi:hypothetical protein O181_021996 [Austropuccinia psidii MF-1]|uniref:Uncharacterized protein n=1 Tax=Austropuccinia psidii MF-1 TaxID=1389203 RepID=A0A9Q3CC08_9BASI|nr:hypothetical protein [Austropuccinia psidii MF-1]
MPHKQTLQQPTPGPSGTQWLEDLFCKPSQHDEPPIPGPSPSSELPEDVTTRETEPEVAPTQSMEEPFGKSQIHFFNSPRLFLTPPLPISSLSRYSPFNHHHRQYPHWIPPPISPSLTPPPSTPTPDLPPVAAENPTTSSPRCQAPLIPTMTLARNSPTCNQH